MMTGVSMPRLRSSRHTSKPLIRGNIRSSSSKSNASREARSRPLSPSAALSTAYPSRVRRSVSVSTMPGSSSIKKILFTPLQGLRCGVADRVAPFGGIAFHHGKRDGKGAARAWRARQRDPSAVCFDDSFHQAQPKAGAMYLRGDDIRGTVEGIENLRLVGWRNADAAIADADLDGAAAVGRANADPPRISAVLECVADEILKDAAQRRLVARDRGQVVVDREFDVDVRGSGRFRCNTHVSQQRRERHGLRRQRALS